MMEKVEIDSADVIKLILQFLKENNLSESWKVLSNESKIHMNTVDDIDLLISDIQNGKWDSVLTQIDTMQLPISKSQLIYEQVIIELLEASERELAKAILREVYPLKSLKESHPERYLKLELLCKRPFFNSSDAYDSGQSKESRRQNIIDLLIPEIAIVQPSRLLTLLNHSLRYQLHQGMISKGNRYDLFRGQRKSAKKDQEEKLPKRVAGQITFNSNSHPETITFSNDGQSLVTGSVDGLIEIWDPDSCKIRDDLEYQAKDNYMAHIDDTVLCVTFSKDTDILASGSMAGDIKVWKLSSGACVRRFDQAHPKGITSLCFGRDGSQLLSTSFDCTARLHGLKSGRTLREFRGHNSFVNCGIFTKDSHTIVTGSSDGTVKVWDAKTTECIFTFAPDVVIRGSSHELTIHTLQMVSSGNGGGLDQLFICSKGNSAYLTTLQGRMIRTYSSGNDKDFLCATISPQGNWVYCVGEDNLLYMFDAQSGQLDSTLNLIDGNEGSYLSSTVSDQKSEVIAITHHPSRNLIVTTTDNGVLKIWRS